MKKLKDLIPKYKLKKGGLFGGAISDGIGGLKNTAGDSFGTLKDSFSLQNVSDLKGLAMDSFSPQNLKSTAGDTLNKFSPQSIGDGFGQAKNLVGSMPTSLNNSLNGYKDQFGDFQNTAQKSLNSANVSGINKSFNKNFDTGLENIGEGVGNFYKTEADIALGAIGLGNVIKDSAYKGNTAKGFSKVGNVGGTVGKVALPYALSTVGVPAPATMAAQTAISTFNPEDGIGDTPTMGKGGTALKALINVEKNELEVNPKTGAIVKDFKDKPYHPENDDMINLKGNTRAKLGNVIIPKNMRKEYLSSNQEGRMEIIHELMEQTNGSMKMQEGGDVVLPNGQKYPSTPLSNFLPPSNKPLYDITKGEIVDGVDRGMVDRTEAIIRPTQSRLWSLRNEIDNSAYRQVLDSSGRPIPGVVPDNVANPMKNQVIPSIRDFQQTLTAELQRKAGAGNQITNQFLTPEEAQKALTAAGKGSYKDYIDNFNTYQNYRDKFDASHNKKNVSGTINPEEELYGIRHSQLFAPVAAPQRVVPANNTRTMKKGGMVSLKDCVKRYDQPPYEVGAQEKYNFEGENSSENPNNSPNFYTSQGTGLYNTPMYSAMSNEITPNADVTETETVDSNGDSSFNMGSLAALGANAGTIGMGINQSRKAGKALKELAKKEVPNYSIDPLFKQGYEGAINNARQLAGTSKAAAGYGFNSAQKAQFNSNLAQQNNTAFRLAEIRTGGNLSKAINAAINSQNISGQNQFAVNDANLQNQKQMYADKTGTSLGELQMRYGNATQTQKNLASQKEIMDRLRLEQAYGLAKSQGNTNIANAGNSLGSLLPLLSKMA